MSQIKWLDTLANDVIANWGFSIPMPASIELLDAATKRVLSGAAPGVVEFDREVDKGSVVYLLHVDADSPQYLGYLALFKTTEDETILSFTPFYPPLITDADSAIPLPPDTLKKHTTEVIQGYLQRLQYDGIRWNDTHN